MHHVTHINASYHTYKGAKVTHINTSCHTYKVVTSQVQDPATARDRALVGLSYVTALTVGRGLSAFLQQHTQFEVSRLGLRVSGALKTGVYVKLLRCNSHTHSKEPYVLSKQPYKEPYTHSRRVSMSSCCGATHIQTQKSPMYSQNNRIKSPIHTQDGCFCQVVAVRLTYTLKRALYTLKRALYTLNTTV